MITRVTYLLLGLLVLHVFYVSPRVVEADLLEEELGLLLEREVREQALQEEKAELRAAIAAAGQAAAANHRRLFPASLNRSAALGQLERAVQHEGLELVRTSWGEPVEEDAGYVRLPLSVVVRGAPPALAGLLRQLESSEKFLRVHAATLRGDGPDHLVMTLVVHGYQHLGSAAGAVPVSPPALPASAAPPVPGQAPAGMQPAKLPANMPRPPGYPADKPWPPKPKER